MNETTKQKLSYAAAMGVAALTLPVTAKAAVVINEVYGGGGNAGATLRQDYIELFNNGTAAVNISGFQLNYGSATGTAAFSATGTDDGFSSVIPTGTNLAAGGFYLIQEAAGASTTAANLSSPNLTDTTPIALSGTTGRVQLIDGSGAQLDFLGWGPTAIAFEGAGPAPVTTNTTSSGRIVNGVDTNNNNLDFSSQTPTPGAPNLVPEPTTLGLAAVGLMMLGRRRK